MFSISFVVYWNLLNHKFKISVITSLVKLIEEPEPEHPLRADLAEEYTKDRKKFMKNAQEHTKKHTEKRPAELTTQ